MSCGIPIKGVHEEWDSEITALQHFNYFRWDTEVRRIILCGTSWNDRWDTEVRRIILCGTSWNESFFGLLLRRVLVYDVHN